MEMVVVRPVPGQAGGDCCCASAPWIPHLYGLSLSATTRTRGGYFGLMACCWFPGVAELAAGLSAGTADAHVHGVAVT